MKCLTPGCQLTAPNTTMSTNFLRPRSEIKVGSSTTCRRCFRAFGTNFAVVQGTCFFTLEVSIWNPLFEIQHFWGHCWKEMPNSVNGCVRTLPWMTKYTRLPKTRVEIMVESFQWSTDTSTQAARARRLFYSITIQSTTARTANQNRAPSQSDDLVLHTDMLPWVKKKQWSNKNNPLQVQTRSLKCLWTDWRTWHKILCQLPSLVLGCQCNALPQRHLYAFETGYILTCLPRTHPPASLVLCFHFVFL